MTHLRGHSSYTPPPLSEKAEHFAMKMHKGQLRKYTETPYFDHVWNVARTIREMGYDDDTVAAAFLHDVMEDCGVTRGELENQFTPRIAELVWWVTDQSKPEDGNRKVRKAIDRAHLAEAPDMAQNIKIADLIDNTSTIVRYDPKFAKVYLVEKALTLDVLTKASPYMLEWARSQLEAAKVSLAEWEDKEGRRTVYLALTRCPGGRIVNKGYICPHCGADPSVGECKGVRPHMSFNKLD